MAVSLYEQFLDNEDSTRIFDIISKWRAKNEAEDKDFCRNVAGTVFELMVYDQFKNRYPDNYIILSPEQTFFFFCELFSYKNTINNYDLSHGIQGKTIPDGAIFRVCRNTIQLTAFIEAKLGDLDQDHNRQIQYLLKPNMMFRDWTAFAKHGSNDMARILRSVQPNIPDLPVTINHKSGYKLFLATPNDSTLYYPRTSKVEMPFSKLEYGRFLRAVIIDCRTDFNS